MPDARFSEDFWTDPKIRKLDHDTQRLFIYLFTNPHRNYCGLYYLPKTYMREGTGLSDRGIDRGIDTLIHTGLIEYSEEYHVVFVKNMLKRQAGGLPHFLNAKQIKGIENHLNRLHGCPLIESLLNYYDLTNINISYTPIHTPLDTPMDAQSQSQSQSQSNINKVQKFSKKSNSKKTEHSLPDNFAISDEIRKWAEKHNFNHLQDHLEWFKDWARANGKRKADWDATFRNAIRGNWGKIDLSKPEIKQTRTRGCPICGRWIEKCICKPKPNEARND